MKRSWFVGVFLLSVWFFMGCGTRVSGAGSSGVDGKGDQVRIEKFGHLGLNSSISEVVNSPIFEGFGRFLFPIRYGVPDEDMILGDIGSLLPYHNCVKGASTAEVVNYMFDEVRSGETIFYSFYTEEEKQDDPRKEDTGLFFFRGNRGAPFAIVCAGGGFSYVGSIHESFPHALELSKRGYNAFAIQYRTGGAKVACEDLAAAISFVFRNAEELGVDTGCYSLWGGSAGARMAAYLGSYGPVFFGGDDLPKPGVVVMQYTGHADYAEQEPPTFVVVGEDDGIASWRAMKQRVDNLRRLGTEVEFHVYPGLGHGFGLGIGTAAEGWFDEAASFWEKQIEVSKSRK